MGVPTFPTQFYDCVLQSPCFHTWRGLCRGSFLQTCLMTSFFPPMTILSLCVGTLIWFTVCLSHKSSMRVEICSLLHPQHLGQCRRHRSCLVNISWMMTKVIHTKWACFMYARFMNLVSFSSDVNRFCPCSLFINFYCDFNSSSTVFLLTSWNSPCFTRFVTSLRSHFDHLLINSPRW